MPSLEELAPAEIALGRAVLAYVRDAKGGRVDPSRVGHRLYVVADVPAPQQIIEAIAAASDPQAYLRAQHPKHPYFEALRKKLAELRPSDKKKPELRIPDGPSLKRGDSHEQVPMLRKRLGVKFAGGSDKEKTYDDALEKAVKSFQNKHGLPGNGVIGASTRKALNSRPSASAQEVKVLINMERWRWLPDDLANNAGLYVWANIPEFKVRVVEGGKVVFDERAIMGKIDKQTPVFSDAIEWIEIHPTWYIPNSIKVADILPSLKRGTSKIMERYHLQLDCGKAGRDPTAVDWDKVDIRKCSVTQPAGDKSVLGFFKFKFPNDHDVYMHDTPQQALFDQETRLFSHGCVRVRNPRRMAEILLGKDKLMSSAQLGAILEGPRRLQTVNMKRPIPVYLTYFTFAVGDDGALVSRPDVYGHDRRLAEALTGQGNLLPAAPVAEKQPQSRREASDRSRQQPIGN